jgi:hypothetical protein
MHNHASRTRAIAGARNNTRCRDSDTGVVCYFRDIEAQVASRRTLTSAAKHCSTLVSVVTDIAWSADALGRFVAPQAAWLRAELDTFQQSDLSRGLTHLPRNLSMSRTRAAALLEFGIS